MADTLLFIRTYVKQNPIPESHGQLFGLSQAKANKWIHLLHPVLHQALADHDLLPARTAAALAALLATPKPEVPSTAPLFGTMGLSGRASVRKLLTSKQNITGARRGVTRAKTSACSLRAVTFAS